MAYHIHLIQSGKCVGHFGPYDSEKRADEEARMLAVKTSKSVKVHISTSAVWGAGRKPSRRKNPRGVKNLLTWKRGTHATHYGNASGWVSSSAPPDKYGGITHYFIEKDRSYGDFTVSAFHKSSDGHGSFDYVQRQFDTLDEAKQAAERDAQRTVAGKSRLRKNTNAKRNPPGSFVAVSRTNRRKNVDGWFRTHEGERPPAPGADPSRRDYRVDFSRSSGAVYADVYDKHNKLVKSGVGYASAAEAEAWALSVVDNEVSKRKNKLRSDVMRKNAKAKQPTYKEASTALFAAFGAAGWKLSDPWLKTRHATKDDWRIWFNPQALYYEIKHDQRFKYGDARTISYDLDIRKYPPANVVAWVVNELKRRETLYGE